MSCKDELFRALELIKTLPGFGVQFDLFVLLSFISSSIFVHNTLLLPFQWFRKKKICPTPFEFSWPMMSGTTVLFLSCLFTLVTEILSGWEVRSRVQDGGRSPAVIARQHTDNMKKQGQKYLGLVEGTAFFL